MRGEIGESTLLILIGFGGLIAAIALSALNGAGIATGSNTFNLCIGHTEEFEVMVPMRLLTKK